MALNTTAGITRLDDLQVIGLRDVNGLHGHSGQDQRSALRYPPLGHPIKGGSFHSGLLQLVVPGRVQVQLGELECDSSGSFVKATKRSGDPVIAVKCD